MVVVVAEGSDHILERCLCSLQRCTDVDAEVAVCTDMHPSVVDQAWARAQQHGVNPAQPGVKFVGSVRTLGDALSLSDAAWVSVVPYADYLHPSALSLLVAAAGEAGGVAACNAVRELPAGRFDTSYSVDLDADSTWPAASTPSEVMWVVGRHAGGVLYPRELYISSVYSIGESLDCHPDTAMLVAAGFASLLAAPSITVIADRLYGHKLDKAETKRRRRSTGGPGDLHRTISLLAGAISVTGPAYSHFSYFTVRQTESLLDELLIFGKQAAIRRMVGLRHHAEFSLAYESDKGRRAFADHSKRWPVTYTMLRQHSLAVMLLALMGKKTIQRVSRGYQNYPGSFKKSIAVDQLDHLQTLQLEVLQSVREVCRRHDISYYLAEGSLLGAVRHGRCIPWDDDLDIAMLRNDYERFIALPDEEWPDNIRLWHSSTDTTYHLPFAKVVSTYRQGFRNTFPKMIRPSFSGVRIDVFPLDCADGLSPKQAEARYRRIKSIRRSLLLQAGMRPKLGNAMDTIAWIRSKVRSPLQLHCLIDEVARGCQSGQEGCESVVNWFSAYGPRRSTVPSSAYAGSVAVKFHNTQQPAPVGYEIVLQTTYGDYQTPPPVNKRYGGSHYLIFDPKWYDVPRPGSEQH